MECINLDHFGIMLDCSRNGVMKPESVKKYIDIISRLGYNSLMLYTEDTYEIKSEQYFGHNRGKYTADELKDIDAYATKQGVELIPCIQTLAHLDRIFRWADFQKVRDLNDILLADSEETYSLIEKMFYTLSECFSSRTINIGMDEAHMLGRGKYLDENGYKSRFEIISKHLSRVADIAKKYGFKIIMWGDMFLGGDLFVRLMQDREYTVDELDAAKARKKIVPDNVEIVYWDYYSTKCETYDLLMDVYSSIKSNLWFAGGLWSWAGFAPHNKFSMYTTEKAFSCCRKHGVKNIFLTLWGDNGNECSKFALLPSMYYAAQLVKGIDNIEKIKAGFYSEFGISFDDFLLLDLPGTPNDCNHEIIDCDKYLLYNDCFMGLFDNTVNDSTGKSFGALTERLESLQNNPDYGYLFKSSVQLCKVLEIKSDIGRRTRKAYHEDNKSELMRLSDDYERLACLTGEFYKSFEKQWMTENKPQGFDVQDIRLGGLICRINHCRQRILQYVNGEISLINELEEPLLDVACRKEDAGKPLQYWDWATIATSNLI